MEQHIFMLSLIIEGATENVSQFEIPLKLMYNKNVCFNEQNVHVEHCREVKTIKNSLKSHFLLKKLFCLPF
jgi:hypothetical protein